MPEAPHPLCSECWDLRVAVSAEECGGEAPPMEDALLPPASTAFSPGPVDRSALDSPHTLGILLRLILCLVITPLMNITVRLSHLLKKHSS